MLNKRVLYVARAGLPIDATGIRISRIGNLLEELGYDIHYVCEKRIDHAFLKDAQEKICEEDLEPWMNKDEVHFKSGKKVYSYLQPFSGEKWDAVKDTVEIITANAAFRRLRDYCEKESPEIIVLYNDVFGLTKKMIPYCKKRGIKLIADVTEWYEKRKNATIPEKLLIYLTDLRIRKLDKHLDGIIAISQYFYEYYQRLGVNCLCIPPLMPIQSNMKIEKYNYYADKQIINFVYAGSPGDKDALLPFIRVIQKNNTNAVQFRLDLVGISEDVLRKLGLSGNFQQMGIYAHGRVSHEMAIDIVKKADFGILFRHNKRYAKAGFSTKFAECMSLGVAMICNRIGGSDAFIQSYKNGLLLDTCESWEIEESLNKLAAMPVDAVMAMRSQAFKDASLYFAADKYLHDLNNLLKAIN